MDSKNKVKISYNFKKHLKGAVTRSQGGVPKGPPARGGSRNRRSIINVLKKSA